MGDYVADFAYGLDSGYNMSRLRALYPYIAANDPNTPNPVAPAAFGINNVAYDVAYDFEGNRAEIFNLVGYVAIREPERHIAKSYTLMASMTVNDPTQTTPLEPFKNAMISDAFYDVAYSPEGSINYASNIVGMVLIKEIKFRKELTTFLVTLHDRKE